MQQPCGHGYLLDDFHWEYIARTPEHEEERGADLKTLEVVPEHCDGDWFRPQRRSAGPLDWGKQEVVQQAAAVW